MLLLFLVVSPAGLSTDYYAKLIEISQKHQRKVVLDSSGKSLEAVLKSSFKPTVIKPNNEELSQLLGKEVTEDLSDLKEVLTDPLFDGIEWIIVSLEEMVHLLSIKTPSTKWIFLKLK